LSNGDHLLLLSAPAASTAARSPPSSRVFDVSKKTKKKRWRYQKARKMKKNWEEFKTMRKWIHVHNFQRTLLHPTTNSNKMYGGYDGSASQFAGQGGFMPTPAGAADTSQGAAGGAVSGVCGWCKKPSFSHRRQFQT
jgi:hypothetical protein